MPDPLLIVALIPVSVAVILVCFGLFELWQQRRDEADAPRWLRWDSTDAEVAEWGDVLRDADEPPTEEFPIVPPEWVQTRDSFARLIDDVARGDTRTLRLRFALEYPTQAFQVIAERNFGVRVTDVGPREITCRVTEGLPTLMEATR